MATEVSRCWKSPVISNQLWNRESKRTSGRTFQLQYAEIKKKLEEAFSEMQRSKVSDR